MTFSKGALRATCLAAAAVATGIAAPPVAAQRETVLAYDLPAQDLGDTLRAIARRTGPDILFPAEAVAGRRAPALTGRFTLAQALRAVLAGSGLVAEQRGGATLIRVGADAARDPAPASAPDGAITITGTRIRGGASASPVIVSTREALAEAGVADLGGFARMLPQNFTGGQNPGVVGSGQGGQSNVNNSTTLNLRGLGPDATLTLINGHRVAYDAANQGMDISAIPLAAVERIEVIADSASALYGSDAVAGVANIILRRDFDGVLTSARFGAATDGGNVQQQYSAVAGTRWSSGGVMAAVDYNRSSAILAPQRTYTRGLDDSATILPRQSQASAALAGHLRLTERITFEFDAQASLRRSRKTNVFFTDTDVFENGLINRPRVATYSITPSLRVALPSRWEGRVSATQGTSRSELRTRFFFGGVETPGRVIYENTLQTAEVAAEGPLFRAPGGAARLAIGGGARRVSLDVTTATRSFTEARDIRFAYGELSVPLVGEANRLPLVERLRLSAALRYERYQGIDAVTTPKLGLVYDPHRDVTIRASWGRAFKVPTLFQVNQLRGASLFDGSQFTPSPVPALPPGATVLVLDGGNPDLTSERATTWTATLELRPRVLAGLRLQASWFDIRYRDRVAEPLSGLFSALANPIYRELIRFNPPSAEVAALVASLPLPLENLTSAPFDPARVVAIVDASLRNAARERARGVDVLADYRRDFGPEDSLTLSLAGSYLASDRQLSAGQPIVERAGRIFNPPHVRARAGASWQHANVSLSGALSYVGGTRDDRSRPFEEVGAFVTLDAVARIRLTAARGPLEGLEIRLTALNLLNEQPDRIRNADPAAPPFDSTNQSAVGRFVGIAVSRQW
ncbi:TonB-dependent receptor [Sphingosinicella sp. LHD-64]|uniref:TonB-dependent receptor n=1 Tax=Sphingosinicella sp. LHD-64 TaxID=3072139 RepID=UPI00280DE678|nr:TonB-dependent receptor [Sphingosinicella sp. LHD-64]MDQ8757408.1 TonB-dependent receptor [Sphingosinicella sp. LHD-64]